VIGNAGQPEGPSAFEDGPFPDFSAFRYDSYGFSTVKVTPTSLHIVHHKANPNGSMGPIIDYFTVTKDANHHKKKGKCDL
jgi:hypothetical protein